MDLQGILNQITQSLGGYVPKLIGALAILIFGWLFALVVSALVRGGLRRTTLDNRLARWLGLEEPEAPKIERRVGKGVYYLILILVLVAFFQALGLTMATEPLNNLLTQVFRYIPRLVGAGLLLLIAWIVASLLKLIVSRALSATKFDERFGGRLREGEGEEEKRVSLAKSISDIVYWLVLLLFLPAILGSLGLSGLLEPTQQMTNKVLSFLPNIFIAGVIIVIGWFLARVVRQLVISLLSAVGADGLSERVGLARFLGEQRLSGVVGLIIYILILIPALIAALNALGLEAITQPTSNMLNMILKAIPSIFAAGLVVTIAYVVGRVVAGLIANLLTGIGFNSILARLGIGKKPAEGEEATEGKWSPSAIVGKLVLVGIMLFAVIEASSLLNFESLSNLVTQFIAFAGRIIVGLIIFGIGLYFANLISKIVQASETAQAGLLAIASRVAILLLAGAIALRQMGLANEIINIAFGLLLGSVAVAVAIAFGIGGREIAARQLEEWTESIKSRKKS